MQLNRTKNELDREARNNENQNWEKIEKIADDISGKAFDQLVDKAKLIWKEPVNTFEDLPSNAEIGETRQIRSTGKVYRWDGTDWNEIQQIDAGPVNEVDTRLTNKITTVQNEIENASVSHTGTNYNNLKERLDKEHQEVTSQLAQKATIGLKNTHILGQATPKIIKKTDNNEYEIITKKANGKGYLHYLLQRGVTTTSNSVGGDAELLRVVQVKELKDCIVAKHQYSSLIGTFTPYKYNYLSVIGGGIVEAMNFWRNNGSQSGNNSSASDSVIYNINVGESGQFNILFLLTPTSTPNAKIYVDDVQIAEVNLTAPSSRILMKTFETTPGEHTIKIETGTAGKYMYVGGINAYHLEYVPTDMEFDTVWYWGQPSSYDYIYNKGALDYALVDKETLLYSGSYHGGETLLSEKFLLDGDEKNLMDGELQVCKDIQIMQKTNIIDKLISETLHSFKGDGIFDFKCTMHGNITLRTIYTCMTTTSDSFKEIDFPIRHTIQDSDTDIFLGRTNTVVQRNPITNQKLTTITTLYDIDENSNNGMIVRQAKGAYNKVYYGKVVYSREGVNITDISFQTTRVFE